MQRAGDIIAFILSVLLTTATHAGMVLIYAFMFWAVYNALYISFPGLPAVTYWQWIAVAIAYSLLTVMLRWRYPKSDEEAAYIQKTGVERFKEKMKWVITITLIALIYGLVY